MKSKINALIIEIEKKKEELKKEYYNMKDKYWFKIVKWKIVFNSEIKKEHKKQKKSVLDTIFSARVRELLSFPFIWMMIIPTIFLDILMFFYMHICFRLYKIPLVKRRDYIIYDRGLLSYLNWIQKINCLYCSYVNGLFSYAVEIAWRTERYWCPIKHAKKSEWGHSREKYFADYWDPKWFKQVFSKDKNTFNK